ncbi:MAG: ComEC/Rec2 family competence protein [Patescibacteria group bacterium]
MSSKTILCITFGFVGGVLWQSVFRLGTNFTLLLAVLAGLSFIYFRLNHETREWLYLSLILVGIILGGLRFQVKDESNFANQVELTSFPVTLTGEVVAEPEERDVGQRLVFQPESWPVRVVLNAAPYPKFFYGERLKVTGKLTRVDNFLADSGQLVPYADYLAAEEIYFQIWQPKIEPVDSEPDNRLRSSLIVFKHWLLERLDRGLPEPEASLAAGLTLGAKRPLGESLTADLRETSLIHIIVLSGYNLSIIATAIFLLLKRFSLRPRIIIAAAAVSLFTLMVGAGPAALRALIMTLIALGAQLSGRRYLAGRALLFAGVLMVVINPKVLVFDPGFQLSFLATAGLIYLSPLITKWLARLRSPITRELIATTLAAQLAVLPWFLSKGIILSPLALPANLLVLPLVPLAMFAGFATMLVPALGLFAWLPTHYILVLAHFVANLIG